MKTKYEHIEEATTGVFDEHEMDITGLSEGIESYATQQAIAFMKFVDAQHGQQTTDEEYDKIYAQFIEQQLPK